MITLSALKRLNKNKLWNSFFESDYKGSADQLMVEIDRGLSALLLSDLKKASLFYKQAASLASRMPPRYRAYLKAMEARLAYKEGHTQTALKKYLQAQEKFRQYRLHHKAAGVNKALISVNMYLGRYEKALDAGQKALRYFRRKRLTDDAGYTMVNIGNVYHRMDRNRQALYWYDQAREIIQEKGGIPLAIIEFNRANIYTNLNQLDEAEKLYNHSAKLYHSAGMGIAEMQAYTSIAYIKYLKSEFAEALTYFEKGHDKLEQLGDVKTAAITLLDIVEIDLELNLYGSAIMLGESIVPRFARYGMNYERGKASYFVARAYLQLCDYRRASVRLNQAMQIFKKEGNYLWMGMVDFARLELNLPRGNYKQALEAANQANRCFRISHDWRRQSDAELGRLETLYLLKRYAAANALVRILQKKKLTRLQEYKFFLIRGDEAYRKKNLTKAIRFYRHSILAVEDMVSQLAPDEIRYFFSIDKYKCYSRLIECLLETGEEVASFDCNLAALNLLSQKLISEAELARQISPEQLKEIKRLRVALSRHYRYPRQKQIRQSGSRSLNEEQQLWRLERRLRQYMPRSVKSFGLNSQTSREICDRLEPGEMLLSYYAGSKLTGAFIATRNKRTFLPLDINYNDLSSLIRRIEFLCEHVIYRSGDGMDSIDALDAYLTQVHDHIIAPILRQFKADRVYIIPNQNFSQIPFLALQPEKGSYLKDVIDIRLLPCPTELLNRCKPATNGIWRKSAYFIVDSEDLPHLPEEGRRLHRIYKDANSYTGNRATVENLSNELSRASGFVHIAAHASRSSENPLFSRILMEDGPFFPFDLIKTGVNSELVTLSGCQTAAPGLYYGNSFSLARSFYQAGAKHVLASLWPVVDRISVEFMAQFYRRLKRSKSVNLAFNQAINALQSRTPHPALWSNFILLGA